MVQSEKPRAARRASDLESELARLRDQIDAVDRALLDQLNERAKLVRAVGELKRAAGAPVYEASRERSIVAGLAGANAGPFPDAGLAPVFREIISATRSLEEPGRIAYLGPEGTFSHEAALRKFGELACLGSAPSITDVFAAVESGKAKLGIVPVENTTEGVVTETLDALAEFDVTICAESVLRISHHLLSRSGRLEDVRQIASHPQPLAQCRRWLDGHLPDAERMEMASTAIAARLAAQEDAIAAIGSGVAADVYGLCVVESSIEDRRDNSTRFLVIGKYQPPASGNDLTSVVFTIRKDQAGGLHRLIEPMARLGVNLTTIQLRPFKGKPWEYLFFLDLEGHHTEAAVTEALQIAAKVASSTRILGSFPRAETEVASGDR
jgi:chorismate mutase/prephenate dehydratase